MFGAFGFLMQPDATLILCLVSFFPPSLPLPAARLERLAARRMVRGVDEAFQRRPRVMGSPTESHVD